MRIVSYKQKKYKEVVKMGNSLLVDFVLISPNSDPRLNQIKKITIHQMAGNLSVETCGNIFADPSREASANYGIDSNGRVGLYVEEHNRSWCSSNSSNDHQSVTIEVANDGGAPNWHVGDKALNKLIDLCVDICQRNGIKQLNYTGDVSGNLTRHNMFAATVCPGPYLESKFPWIAEQVNKRLGQTVALYRVRKNWANAASQIGAYTNLDNAKKACDSAGKSYYVFDENGNVVYPVVNQNYRVKVMADALNIRSGPGTQYKINECIRDCGVYTIVETQGNWGLLKSGQGWICLDYVAKV